MNSKKKQKKLDFEMMQWRKIPAYAGWADVKCDSGLDSVYKLNNDTHSTLL